VDDLLLIQAESGDVVLVEISPERPRVRARFPALHGKTWNNPALLRDLLLVRNDQEAACYRLSLNAFEPR
jgi:outer membrane protein assembly factor BamB